MKLSLLDILNEAAPGHGPENYFYGKDPKMIKVVQEIQRKHIVPALMKKRGISGPAWWDDFDAWLAYLPKRGISLDNFDNIITVYLNDIPKMKQEDQEFDSMSPDEQDARIKLSQERDREDMK